MKIQELILKDENELTVNQIEFLKAHNKILTCGSIIGSTLVELAINLKTMKEKELYKEAGFETFEDYSEQACNLGRTQAYKYIQVLDKLGVDFVHSSGQIGITKLSLLSSLTEEEKQVIIENNKVDAISVNELKEEIAKLKSEKEESFNKLASEISESKKLQEKIEKLKRELEKLKSKPVEKEIVQDPKQTEKIEELKKELERLEKKVEEDKQYKKELNQEIDSLCKQVLINNSKELIEINILFDEIQNKIIKLKNLILKVPEEKQVGLRNALKKVGEQLC